MLTNEQKRIRIAEACGWQWRPYGDTMAWYFRGVMRWFRATLGLRTDVIPTDPLPNYLNDLNAMHEAEKIVWPNKWTTYKNILARVCEENKDAFGCYNRIRATAAERAEAFGRTLNLW